MMIIKPIDVSVTTAANRFCLKYGRNRHGNDFSKDYHHHVY